MVSESGLHIYFSISVVLWLATGCVFVRQANVLLEAIGERQGTRDSGSEGTGGAASET